jgi:hypothetical protein
MNHCALKGMVSLGVVAFIGLALSSAGPAGVGVEGTAWAQPRTMKGAKAATTPTTPTTAAPNAAAANVQQPSWRLPNGRACDNNGNGCLGARESCREGVCVCDTGAVRCGKGADGKPAMSCTAIAQDESNCGACGKACGPGLVCDNGACKRCPMGQSLCQGACVNLLDDLANCGQCGRSCPNNLACQNGACRL